MSFKLFNTQIRISFWFFAMVAAAVTLGTDMGLLLTAALIHEAGHLLAVVVLGGSIDNVIIGAFGARMESRFKDLASFGQDALILLAGPLAGGITAVAAGLLGWRDFALINGALTVFNLLPIEGLDGGSLMRALLCWHWGYGAQRVATIISKVVTLLLLAVGIALLTATAPMPALLFAGCLLLAGGMRG